MKQGWVALRLQIHPSNYEKISAVLWELGTLGTRIESESEENIYLLSYFDRHSWDLQETTKALLTLAGSYGLHKRAIKSLSQVFITCKNWVTSWRRSYRRFTVGRKFLIVPSWDNMRPYRERITIKIDPGLAFGSGLHESTKLCLLAIERFMRPNSKVLDVGTGSGILAIAAAKLLGEKEKNSGSVTAIDEDNQAIETARKNIKANRVSKLIGLYHTALSDAPLKKYDFITANLTAKDIVNHAEIFKQALKPSGYLIVSGILKSQLACAIRKLRMASMTRTETTVLNEWTAVIFENRRLN